MQLFGLVNALLYNDRRTGVNSEDLQVRLVLGCCICLRLFARSRIRFESSLRSLLRKYSLCLTFC